jgi:integrase
MNDPVEDWLNSVAYSHSQSKATEDQYKRVWERFSNDINMTPEEIIADYERSNDRKVMRKHARLIRSWIGQLMKEGLINTSIKVMVGAVKSFYKYNDLPLGIIPQAMSGIVYHNRDITKEEIVQIMAVVKLREKAFFAVMAQSGLRPHTIRQLRLKHLEDFERVPCKIEVPQELAKGKYGSYVTFIGPDTLKYLKQYLATRKNLTSDSLLFCAHDDPKKPVNVKDMSRAFRLAARKLEKSGAIEFEIREGKPSELRLYNLRKFFRKYANQMGFENVNYLMGHTVRGSDANYKPQDPEFYRQLYAEKAMPFLRLEEPTPTETEMLRQQHKKEMEDLQKSIAERDEKIKELEHNMNSMDEKFSLALKMLVPTFPPEERMKARKQLEESFIKDGIITREELERRAKKLEEDFKAIMQEQVNKAIEEDAELDKIYKKKLKKAVQVLKETQPELFE